MSLKQSCFKATIKSDLKRSWWISVLSCLVIFLCTTSPLLNYSQDYRYYSYSRYDSAVNFATGMFANYVIGMFVSAFAVLYLFSYINKVNSVTFFHSLPTNRSTLLSAHITSGLLIVVLPMLVNTLVSFLAVGRGVRASWLLLSFCIYIVYSLVVFSLTLFVSMLTGVSIASGIFSLVLALLPLFVFAFTSTLCEDYLYGYSGFNLFEDFLVNYVYLSPEMLLTARILIYILLSVLLFALSYFIYKKRHLENYGEVIAFPKLKGLFKVLFGLCSGVLGYYYFKSFWDISSILTMLVFGAVGVIAAHMMANKSFSIKGVFKSLGVTACLILLLFVSFFFDLFGFETRIPDLEEIEYVDISNLYYEDYSYVDSDIYGEGRIRVKRKDPYVPHFNSEEEIKKFIELHEYAISHQEENDDWNDDFFTPSYRITERRSFSFEYHLKNGAVVRRSYRLPTRELEAYTTKIYSTDTYRKYKFPILDGTEKEYRSVGVYDARSYYDDEYVRISAQEDNARRIIEALTLDRKNISYERMDMNHKGALVTVELNYMAPYASEDGFLYKIELSDSYTVSEYDVNTWALLEELDLFAEKRKIQAQDIKSAEVYVSDYNYGEDVALTSFPAASASQMERVVVTEDIKKIDEDRSYKIFTAKEDIEVLYNLFLTHHNNVLSYSDEYAIIELHLNLHEGIQKYRILVIPSEKLPDCLSFVKDFYVIE